MPHLYLHVPFCSRRCSYCDFAIAVRRTVPDDRYVAAIRGEHALRRRAATWDDAPFETIYLGGGTPSKLSADAVARLLEPFPRSPTAEVTLEANPEDVNAGKVAAWRAAGVNRVSLGVQSLDDRVLGWMHRTHDAATARAAFRQLRDGGVPSVSVDLIFGLPETLSHDVRRDVEGILAFDPDHVSAYGLTLEPRTPYARWSDSGAAPPAPDERYCAEFFAVHERLTAAGFEHYEISNYARAGQRSRHNSAYWTGVDYVGLGPSAHGLEGRTRRWNVRDWARYEPAVRAGEDPVEGTETLTDRQRSLERVYLALRTTEGLPPDSGSVNPETLLAAASAGWLTTSDRIRATPAGWLVLDALVPALTTFPEGG